MKKIDAGDPETRSADLFAENVEHLKALFPEAFTEGKVDFDVLRQVLGGAVDEREEKYGLNWHGKRRARQLALTPSTGTLRPCPADSVDWDTTQNLMIEGDNLEVLKLLQKSYAGKVKLIYIDPPYNTGKDFVYPDNFQDNIKNYLEITGQTGEGGKKLSSNTEASGRFHTDWLNMMYPRLKLARNLLREDGAVFISSDDGEVANLRAILDDIFGAENFVAQFVWKARQFTDARAATNVSTDHEYILAYARDAGFAVRGVGRDESKFTNPDDDPRGPWMSRSMLGLATRDQRPNLHYDIVESVTGRRFPPNPSTGWRYSPDKMQRLIEEHSILFPPKDDGRPREKKFRKDMMADFIAFRSIIDGVHTANGTEEIRTIFGAEVFNFPKPTELLRQLVEQVADTGDLVMDFFAGSATTAHAVWLQNKSANDFRRWILVQLPEPLDPANIDQKVAVDFCDKIGKPRTIAELTKERLRRAGKKIREENPLFVGDLGFRVFKLASSNIRAWEPDRDKLAETLEVSIEHLKTDRTEQDILFELLLKLGLDLCVPIETKTIASHEVHSIGAGSLLVCLSSAIPQSDVEPLALGLVAWHQALRPAGETTVVFRDSAFADDVAKTNLTAILHQHGLENVKEPVMGRELEPARQNRIVLYTTADGKVTVDVYFAHDNFWLTQRTMAELFGVKTPAVSRHLKNIYASGELTPEATISKMETVQTEGQRQIAREVDFYNLDAVIAVGYRVNSVKATHFRIWATNTLREFVVKGFVLNDQMLKNGRAFGKDYFDELLERIREIRASERRAYQKIADVFEQCSSDYRSHSDETQLFYQIVQNQLHFATTGKTAAEIVHQRADSGKPFMGLTTWKHSPKGKILKSDVTVAKNYLNQAEVSKLNRLVGMFIDFAELRALNHQVMTMKDWVKHVEKFLNFTEQQVLRHAGRISHEMAVAKAYEEYEKYRVTQDREYISDFDQAFAKYLKGGDQP